MSCSPPSLKKLDQIDESRKQREQAKNQLEAFIYYTRNKLYTDADDVAVSSGPRWLRFFPGTCEQRMMLCPALPTPIVLRGCGCGCAQGVHVLFCGVGV